MALSTSTIPITFPGGLDQKTPAKIVMPGKFLALENCVRRKSSLIEKRFGYASLGKTVFGSTTEIDAGSKLDVFVDDLILMDGESLYSYSSGNDAWINKGTAQTALATVKQFIRNDYTQSNPDVATLNGVTVVVWSDSRGGVRYSVFDDETNSALVNDVELHATATRPKVIAVQNGFVIGYRDSTNLKTRYVARATPTTVGASVTLSANVRDSAWDMASYGDYGVFTHDNSSSSLVRVGYITSLGAAGASGTNGLPDPVELTGMGTGANALTIVPDTTLGRLWIGFHGSAGDVKAALLTADLLQDEVVVVETIANIRNITGVVRAADGYVQWFYEQSAASAKNYLVKRAVTRWTGTGSPTVTTAAAVHRRSAGLASKAWELEAHQYALLSHDSTLQPSYYLTREDGYILARLIGNTGGGHSSASGGISNVVLDANDHYMTALQVRNKLTIESGGKTLTANKGISRTVLDFESRNLVGATLGRNYHIAGGSLLAYDGVRVVEHGFFLGPEDVSAANAATGALTAGTYNFRVIYEWTDAQGQLHRSSPSITVSGVVTGAGDDQIDLTIPTLRLTNRTATDVKIVVYAAVKDLSTVYYRHTATANTASDTVVVSITAAVVTSSEILYTTGGVLENISAPAAKVVHVHKNRLFLGGTETGDLAFSKEHVTTEGVAFQDLIPIKVESDGGDVTALATLDDKLVLFKRDRIYILVGDGPLDTGIQNDYGPPQRVASDVGTNTPQSVVSTPVGIMFKSDKGIYLLGRALNTSYIGAGVEDYNSETITSAVLLADDNEVRFTTASGVCLVFNYYFNQWSTFSDYAAVSACNGLSSYLHMEEDGTVQQETIDVYNDNGRRYSMAIETSWLSFAGIQGYQRIYEVLLLGDFVSHHHTRIKVAYDHETAYNETKYFNTVTGVYTGELFGDDTPYGNESPFGAGSDVYQCSIQPQRQKCQAMKLRIEDIDTISVSGGGSFKLVAMTCEVGSKRGTNKMAATRSFDA